MIKMFSGRIPLRFDLSQKNHFTKQHLNNVLLKGGEIPGNMIAGPPEHHIPQIP